MTKQFVRKISVLTITLMFMGVFANPQSAKADWSDILGVFGIGSNSSSNYGYSNNSYNYDATAQQNQGDLELSKRVRRVNRDQEYHESTTVRSGELVEIRIEVKNKSSQVANTVVTDEIDGNAVYVPNTLSLNGSAIVGGLTSGGVRMSIPAKTTYTIWYRLNICSASGYVTRANAYSANVGSAVDGIQITMENQNYGYGYYNDVSSCMNQFQNSGSTNSGTQEFYGGPTSAGNPFANWTGVNNSTSNTSSNPFAGWTGVNNANATLTTNSSTFGNWTGVNNSGTNSSANPFAGWSGVNNGANSSAQNSNSTFGSWTGVNNSSVNSSSNANNANAVFGNWTGVNNSGKSSNVNDANSVFGSWTGVNNNTQTSGQTSNDIFGSWTGVNNSNSSNQSANDIFGTWTGVNNSSATSSETATDIFGNWTGVNNQDGSYGNSTSTNVFGNWYGVSNSASNANPNPFGNWTGVNNNNGYNASGYQVASVDGVGSMSSGLNYATAPSTLASTSTTRFVAPTTGVDKAAPFVFAGLLTAAFVVFRNRKALFN